MSARTLSAAAAASAPEEALATIWWFSNCRSYLQSVFAGLPLSVVIYGGFALNLYIGNYLNPGLDIISSYFKGLEFTTVAANDVDAHIHSVTPDGELPMAEFLLRTMGRDWPPTSEEARILQSPAVKGWMARNKYLPKGLVIHSTILTLPEGAPFPLLVGRIFPFLRNDSATNTSQHFQLQIAAVTPSLKVIGLTELTFSAKPPAIPLPSGAVVVQQPRQLRGEFQALLTFLRERESWNEERIQKTATRIQKIDEFLRHVGVAAKASKGGSRRRRTRRRRSRSRRSSRAT